MKKLIIIVLLLLSITLNGQTLKSKLKQYSRVAPFFALSGIAGGVEEGALQTYNYSYFKRKFPKANDQFWNPNVSYLNKWKLNQIGVEKFPLSSSVLVWVTDGYHLIRMVKRTSGYTGIAINGIQVIKHNRKQKWWWYFVDAAVYSVVWSVSFHATYNWIQY